MMPGEVANGRNHEPNLRELTAQLDDLRELVMAKFDNVAALSAERDRRYEQRFGSSDTAVSAALSAQKEGTAAAFAASEKAIVKAEIAQQNYNDRSNEFRQALDDSNKSNISRNEADTRFKAIEDKLDDARAALGGRADESKSVLGGKIEEVRNSMEKGDRELRESIQNLRESRSVGEGAAGRGMTDRLQTNWAVSAAIGLAGLLAGIAFNVFGR